MDLERKPKATAGRVCTGWGGACLQGGDDATCCQAQAMRTPRPAREYDASPWQPRKIPGKARHSTALHEKKGNFVFFFIPYELG